MNNARMKYMVVEGPIGVGKTVLAKRLANTFKAELMLENPEDNPFLPKFYEDPKNSALPTQLHFLFQRLKMIEVLRQTDMFKPAQISDFLMQKDQLFAEVTLNDSEFDLYNQVYSRLVLEAPIPDLVIYLQAPVDLLLKRIYERKIVYEKRIEDVYLNKISEAYIKFFYHYNASPTLIVNTSEINLVDSDDDYDYLLNYIRTLSPGKHYLNPQKL
ncbi:MAG: deoxyguanosine kinase [Gammaproteobacteria bacterium]|jgi:deoxyguanosine kinase